MTAEETLAVGYLPERLARAVLGTVVALSGGMDEIRLRRGGLFSLTSGGENVSCGVICTADELEFTVGKLCRNSLYSQAESICEGCITTEHGIRAGVCGRAVVVGGGISCVRDISSISIRIPHRVPGAAEPLRSLIMARKSVLLYSAPGVGKTTVLRELIPMISSELKMRCAVIDTRYELASGGVAGKLCDIFAGYPRSQGITIAVRTMSPEYIICDEVADTGDATALLYARASGVSVCASAHASDMNSLRGNAVIASMLAGGVFDCVCGITRRGKVSELTPEVTE